MLEMYVDHNSMWCHGHVAPAGQCDMEWSQDCKNRAESKMLLPRLQRKGPENPYVMDGSYLEPDKAG